MRNEKIKGILVFLLGLSTAWCIWQYDAFRGRPRAFGTKAVLAFSGAVICVVNGIRIFNRKPPAHG